MIDIFSLSKHELNFNFSIENYQKALMSDIGISNMNKGILIHGEIKANVGCIKNVYVKIAKLTGSCKKMQKDFGFERTTTDCILCHRNALEIYRGLGWNTRDLSHVRFRNLIKSL